MWKKVYTEKEVLSGERDAIYYINGERYPYLEIYDCGTTIWKKGNIKHRTDAPAYLRSNGSKLWYLNNKPHRTDGPARLWSEGDKYWYVKNKFYRIDGPAVIYEDGTQEWWINGKETTQENIEKLQEKYFYKWKRK